LTPPQANNTNILLAIMSPRNEVFQAIPFDASSDVNEPLIAVCDAEEEDHRLEEKTFSRRFKLSYLLLGLLVGFFDQFAILGVKFLVITTFGASVFTKSNTAMLVISLLCSFFFSAITLVILGFLRNLVAISYSAIGGRSKNFFEEMVLYMEWMFVVGALVGFILAWPMMEAVLLGMRAPIRYGTTTSRVIFPMYCLVTLLVVTFFWRKIMMMYFATHIKPSSSRRSMMAV
jgi:hypothetical protein